MATAKKLTIVVLPPLDGWEEVMKLAEQGHTIVCPELGDVDLIIGPHCWRMDELHRQYLDMAIKTARKTKKKEML